MLTEDHAAFWQQARVRVEQVNKESWRGFWYAKINAPSTSTISKRHSKGGGKGVGSVLKHSFIKPQVPLEKVFLRQK